VSERDRKNKKEKENREDAMRENTGNTKVKGGFYFNRKTWDVVTVNGKEGMLPGGEKDRFIKVPTLLMLAAAPVWGGALVIFLPLIGFALLFGALARKAGVPLKGVPKRLTEKA
jgi:hypothetical protein